MYPLCLTWRGWNVSVANTVFINLRTIEQKLEAAAVYVAYAPGGCYRGFGKRQEVVV